MKKYADSQVEVFNSEILKELEQIAMKADPVLMSRGGIEARLNDGEDFVEVSVNAIQTMLEKAYLLGKNSIKEVNV